MQHPYAAFLDEVQKPVRYIGGEYGSVVKDPQAVKARVALAFPDAYEIGVSHLGLKILYQILNAHPDIAAERVCAPWLDLEAKLREKSLPLVTLDSATPLGAFDVIGFTLQYEMTFTNILTMLDLAGLPLRAAARDLAHPLIIAGGPVATHPEALAPFIDCFVIGDGEEITPALVLAWQRLREAGHDKTRILRELTKLGGIYCPALYTTVVDELTGLEVVDQPLYDDVPPVVRRAFVEDINRYPFPTDSPVPYTEVVFDRFSIEIARGCTEGCRFCQAGMIYRPVRERKPEDIVDAVMEGLRKGGYDETSITSLSTADYSCVTPLVKALMARLKQEKVSLGVSSLRAYGLSEEVLDEMAEGRNTSLTFAPEAGTQRMRDVVNKNITEEDLLKTAHRVFARGWQTMKFYFMIGLPTEEDEDVVGIIETAERALHVGWQYHKNRRKVEVTASVSSFVPKPHTPFQWCRMDDIEAIARKQQVLYDLAKARRVGYKYHDRFISHLECIIARGDRRLADAIELAWRRGCRFDGWDDQFKFETWMAAIRDLGIDTRVYLSTLRVDGRLPWDHIDVGITKEFLARDYRRALADKGSPPCGKPVGLQVHHTNLEEAAADTRRLMCYHCGVACDLTQMRDERLGFLAMMGAREKPPPKAADQAPRVVPSVRQPRPAVDQGQTYRYRLTYAKLGRAVFISHLDTIHLIPRVLRRAGFPLYYSQGFHPKPELTFGPALALGVASIGELLDVWLLVDAPPEEVRNRLNAAAPEGIHFLACERLEETATDIARVAEGGEYLLGVGRAEAERLLAEVAGTWGWGELPPADALARAAARVLAAETLVVTRRTKDGTRPCDIRPYVLGARPVASPELPEGFLAPADALFLEARLRVAGEGSARPSELLDALFGAVPAKVYALRRRLFSLRAPSPHGGVSRGGDQPEDDASSPRRHLPFVLQSATT